MKITRTIIRYTAHRPFRNSFCFVTDIRVVVVAYVDIIEVYSNIILLYSVLFRNLRSTVSRMDYVSSVVESYVGRIVYYPHDVHNTNCVRYTHSPLDDRRYKGVSQVEYDDIMFRFY